MEKRLAKTSDEKEMAEELNNYFSSVYTREDRDNIPIPEKKPCRSKLTNAWITTAKVMGPTGSYIVFEYNYFFIFFYRYCR